MKYTMISLFLVFPIGLFGQNYSQGKNENKESASESFKSYSRFDFVSGEKIVYAEDFSQDVTGEFPLKWVTDNRGEVVTMNTQQGKWLRMYPNSLCISPLLKNLPENFTVEFDMVLNFQNDGYSYPLLQLLLFENIKGDESGRKFIGDVNSRDRTSIIRIGLQPGEEESSSINMESLKKGAPFFSIDDKRLPKLDASFKKVIHVALWIQKRRLRLWIGSDKVYDIPQAVPDATIFNRLGFTLASTAQEPEQLGYYLSNIKVAEGTADLRSKLLTEGKFSTNGILFDTGSDKIKPESYGILKEIAAILKENPSVKVKITGHTDSDGNTTKNLELSKRRSTSVKNTLTSEFSIDPSRMETDGKGSTLPIADNSKEEGKAMNRRVEFIKVQ